MRLRWSRDTAGYVLRKRSIKLGDPEEFPDDIDSGVPEEFTEERLFPIGGKIETYDVALGDEQIFAELLTAAPTDEGFLAFSNRWGMMCEFPTTKYRFIRAQAMMVHAHEEKLGIDELGRIYSMLFDAVGPVAHADIRFGQIKRKSPLELMWYVQNLQQFCLLEFFQDLGGASHIAKCSGCGKFFTRSNAKGPAPEHCSNACRQKLYRSRLAQRA